MSIQIEEHKLEDIVDKTSKITIEEDDEVKELEDTPQKIMLQELESMYTQLSTVDMKIVRKHMNSEPMKDTITKLHTDFRSDFKDIPSDDVIYIRCCELLGYLGIPPVIASHDDLQEGKRC